MRDIDEITQNFDCLRRPTLIITLPSTVPDGSNLRTVLAKEHLAARQYRTEHPARLADYLQGLLELDDVYSLIVVGPNALIRNHTIQSMFGPFVCRFVASDRGRIDIAGWFRRPTADHALPGPLPPPHRKPGPSAQISALRKIPEAWMVSESGDWAALLKDIQGLGSSRFAAGNAFAMKRPLTSAMALSRLEPLPGERSAWDYVLGHAQPPKLSKLPTPSSQKSPHQKFQETLARAVRLGLQSLQEQFPTLSRPVNTKSPVEEFRELYRALQILVAHQNQRPPSVLPTPSKPRPRHRRRGRGRRRPLES